MRLKIPTFVTNGDLMATSASKGASRCSGRSYSRSVSKSFCLITAVSLLSIVPKVAIGSPSPDAAYPAGSIQLISKRQPLAYPQNPPAPRQPTPPQTPPPPSPTGTPPPPPPGGTPPPPSDPNAPPSQGPTPNTATSLCRNARLALLKHPESPQCQLAQYEPGNTGPLAESLKSICETCMPEWDRLLADATRACVEGDEKESVLITKVIVAMDRELYCSKRTSPVIEVEGKDESSDDGGDENTDPLGGSPSDNGDSDEEDDSSQSDQSEPEKTEQYCYITNSNRTYRYTGNESLSYPEMPGSILCSECVKLQSATLLQYWSGLEDWASKASALPITAHQANENLKVRGPMKRKIEEECGGSFDKVHTDDDIEKTIAAAVEERGGEEATLGNDVADLPKTLWGAAIALLLGIWLSLEL